jgi:Replication initiator protein A
VRSRQRRCIGPIGLTSWVQSGSACRDGSRLIIGAECFRSRRKLRRSIRVERSLTIVCVFDGVYYIGMPKHGLPFGQDRIVPIYLATLAVRQQSQTIRFRTAAEMLETFDMHKGGKEYRRLVAAFERIFGATIFFGTDGFRGHATVVQRSRFSFFREAQIWYGREPDQYPLSDQFENVIVLSDEFYREVTAHPIPADLELALSTAIASGRCSKTGFQTMTTTSTVQPLVGNVAEMGMSLWESDRAFSECRTFRSGLRSIVSKRLGDLAFVKSVERIGSENRHFRIVVPSPAHKTSNALLANRTLVPWNWNRMPAL